MTLMAAAAIGGWGALARGQEPLHLSRDVPGESKPVGFQADDIATWTEGTDRLFLLRGRVLVEEGVVQLRCQQALARVDLKGFQETHIYRVQVYAEGDIQLESGAKKETGASGLIDLSTRGKVTAKGKVTNQALATDPLYLRAQAARKVKPVAQREVQPGTAPSLPAPATPYPVLPPLGAPTTAPGSPAPAALPPATPAPAMTIPTTPVPMLPGSQEASSANPIQPASYQDRAAPVGPEDRLPQTVRDYPLGETSSSSKFELPSAAEPDSARAGGGSQPVASLTAAQDPPAPTPPVPAPVEPTPGPGPALVPPGAPGPPGSTPAPGATPGPAGAVVAPPPRPVVNRAAAGPRSFSIAPRYGNSNEYKTVPVNPEDPNGEQAVVFTGGVILTVRNVERLNVLDVAADRLVVWMHGNVQQSIARMRNSDGQASRDLQFYLAGNVVVREQMGKELRTMEADEVFYDVERNVAVARHATLQVVQMGIPDPIYIRGEEVQQLSPTEFRSLHGEIFSSRLPSDPGVELVVDEATLELKKRERRSIFGTPFLNRKTGQPEMETQELVHADNVVLDVWHVPIFYLPFIDGDAREPLGPVSDIGIGYNSMFGATFDLGLNTYNLLGIDPLPNTKWRTTLEYLTLRGPAVGTDFAYQGKDPFDIPGRYSGNLQLWGIYDTGQDILGGPRNDTPHPDWRGRAQWRQNVQDLPHGFSLQTQVAAVSDINFMEEYFNTEFNNGPNQDTFVYLKQQQDNWAWTALVQPHLQPWYTETAWLPRADGYWIGQDILQTLTYNTWASVGYAHLREVDQGAPPFTNTDASTDTLRADWSNELALPFYLGPVKVVPYGVFDLTEYTTDLQGGSTGRVYGGGGVRASVPFTRLYPEIQSTLFNVNGINHKVVLSGNYYYADTNEPYTRFPQLDRLNDDATDQALRQIRPLEPGLVPGPNGVALATSPLYNPQTYAIRRLLDSAIDTRDHMDVFQADIFQRWQTKRGFPEQQHIIDWMTLDLSGSFFPEPNRDNFGHSVSFLEYDYNWNIGDRTAISSTGWLDPYNGGAHVFTIGASLNRPDRTAFYLGFRELQPLGSEEVIASVSYVLSPKYAVTAAAVYDFGTSQAQSDSLIFTRVGKDLQVSVGVNYNALTNNFGFVFTIVPNVAGNTRQLALTPGLLSGNR